MFDSKYHMVHIGACLHAIFICLFYSRLTYREATLLMYIQTVWVDAEGHCRKVFARYQKQDGFSRLFRISQLKV